MQATLQLLYPYHLPHLQVRLL
jgi:hypothetical protein